MRVGLAWRLPAKQKWCPGTELNRRHEDFQSSALPTELPGLIEVSGLMDEGRSIASDGDYRQDYFPCLGSGRAICGQKTFQICARGCYS
jgi:hypothetical protein